MTTETKKKIKDLPEFERPREKSAKYGQGTAFGFKF
jgi:hypothetical protein